MEILILIILAVGIIIFLCKRFNISKKMITIIAIAFLIIGIFIMLLNKFNIINKIMYQIYTNQPTITQEEKEQALATICYINIIGIDAQTYETCYIYKNSDNTYHYFITNRETTIAGPQEEKINKNGNINNKKQLKKIINDFEKKIKSGDPTMEYLTINYNSQKVEKEEFLTKMFN